MKKILFFILVIVCLGVIYVGTHRKNTGVMNGDEAVALVKKAYPAYEGYPSDTLPPKRTEVIETEEGWRVGMYDEGSGIPGILKADCFLVTRQGVVSETGFFHGEGPAKSINLFTCTPKD